MFKGISGDVRRDVSGRANRLAWVWSSHRDDRGFWVHHSLAMADQLTDFTGGLAVIGGGDLAV
jgi:hypothetical protein